MSPEHAMRVVCTAGHVDHGKSTLVRALTGMEPDRFAEEQRRGLTIDLGFAWTDLTAGATTQTVAFVDLPGHERFIGNMLAGAGAVDTALFVVAADEGWMPQSQEHLEILDLLGISRGVVALTKADTVDAETLELGVELVREELRGTAFADVGVVPVSAATGTGIKELVARLTAVLSQAPPAGDARCPRLWVDRAFSVRGAGTVVTGTLSGGILSVGEDVEVLPSRRTVRVRGLQSLRTSVQAVGPGSRVAVNLTGIDRGEVPRGSALAAVDRYPVTTALDAWVRALPGREIGRKGAWHLHGGSGEWTTLVSPLLNQPVRAHQPGFVRLVLSAPAPLVAGDRFVLREAGRQATIGGGMVLDAAPPTPPRGTAARRARTAELEARLDALLASPAGDRGRLLALHVAERGVADTARAAAAVGLHVDEAASAAAEHGLLPLGHPWGHAWAHPAAVTGWTKVVTAALEAYHADHPVERVAPKDVAVRALTSVGCPPERAAEVLGLLEQLGRVEAEGPGVRAPGHAVVLDAEQAAARAALLERLSTEPFSPPGLAEAAAASGASPALVRELEAAGDIVRVAADLAFTARAVDEAVAVLRRGFDSEGPLSTARAKELLGTTRKYALPLLEALDRGGRSRRVGDSRVILG